VLRAGLGGCVGGEEHVIHDNFEMTAGSSEIALDNIEDKQT
jgi:hypothetical protein